MILTQNNCVLRHRLLNIDVSLKQNAPHPMPANMVIKIQKYLSKNSKAL